MNLGFRMRLASACTTGLCCLFPATSDAAKTAFRISDLDWRDPHVFVAFIGCRDITDVSLGGFSMNGDLQTKIQTDSNGDGNLDLNYLIVFDPLDQSGSGGVLRFGDATCTAPAATTTCEPPYPLSLKEYSYVNMGTTCLGTILGTTHPYTPAVTSAASPCFVATLGTITLDVGFPLTLLDAYLAASYVGDPALSLVNGLIRGFVSEADANATILSASYPLIGGQPLSMLLAGGDPPGPGQNCVGYSDKDIGPGDVPGWYMYFNFVATAVPFTEDPTGAHISPSRHLELETPWPNPFNPSTTIRYTLAETAPVRLAVYDARGGRVVLLVDDVQEDGEHESKWNGRDARGGWVSSGVYFVRLESRGEVRVRKIVLLK